MPGLPHRIRGTHRRPDGNPPPLYPRPYRVPAASDPYGSEPDPLPAAASALGDQWLDAARTVVFDARSPEAASARRFIDGLRGEDLWPRYLDARPEMLPAPATQDVTSVPVPDGNPGSGPAGTEVTHESPNVGESVTPCCGKTPFELPRTDRMTLDPSLVNCPSRPASGTVTHRQPGPGSTVLPCCGMSLFDLSKDSETAADLALVTCRRTDGPAAARHLQNRALVAAASPHAPEASPVPERPAASAVAAEQGGGEGPAGQPGPSCPAGLAAASPEGSGPAEVPVKPSVAAEARAARSEP